METEKVSIDDLSWGAIDMQPVNFDWTKGFTETWDFIQASRCEKCQKILVGCCGDKHANLDEDSECDGYVPEASEPMSSYYYPLQGLDEDDARKLVDMCLCVVTVNGETGLALTGGGMDLSWEICEAFMLLGHLPPMHFADLPAMSGRGTSATDQNILRACLKTCQVVSGRARSTADRINQMVKGARHNEQIRRNRTRKTVKEADASPLGTPVYFKAKVAKKPSKK